MRVELLLGEVESGTVHPKVVPFEEKKVFRGQEDDFISPEPGDPPPPLGKKEFMGIVEAHLRRAIGDALEGPRREIDLPVFRGASTVGLFGFGDPFSKRSLPDVQAGIDRLRDQQNGRALEIFRGAVEWAEGQGSTLLHARALYNLGVAYLVTGEYGKARTAFQEARDRNDSLRDVARDALDLCNELEGTRS